MRRDSTPGAVSVPILLWLMYGNCPYAWFFPLKVIVTALSCFLLHQIALDYPKLRLLGIPLVFFMAVNLWAEMRRDQWIPWDWGFIATISVILLGISLSKPPEIPRLTLKSAPASLIPLVLLGGFYSFAAAILLSVLFPSLPFHFKDMPYAPADDFR